MTVDLPSLHDFQERRHPVAVVGLGYVGLPLAVAFARHCDVVGFDVNEARIAGLAAGEDRTGETGREELEIGRAHV